MLNHELVTKLQKLDANLPVVFEVDAYYAERDHEDVDDPTVIQIMDVPHISLGNVYAQP